MAQREQLVRKGNYPHLLVMTATPIPRTLGLTLYGDLDVSVIDEMPAGRGRVKTFVRTAEKLPKVWEFIREKLAAGRQAYVIYPRVEEQDTANDIKAVTKEFENVQRALAPFRVGLLHGRLKSREKDEVMTAFRANQIQALVATALIEVGVDVPNATVMLIENAERFGLAQLHQLRGRIGRGAHESQLHPDFRREKRGGAATIESPGGDDGRISHRRGGLEIARAGRIAGPAAKRLAPIPLWQSGGRPGFDPAGAGMGLGQWRRILNSLLPGKVESFEVGSFPCCSWNNSSNYEKNILYHRNFRYRWHGAIDRLPEGRDASCAVNANH